MEVQRIRHTETNAMISISKAIEEAIQSVNKSYKDIVIVCIGTDRYIGDCLGPLVGNHIRDIDYPNVHVMGTLEDPLHAVNLKKRLIKMEYEYPESLVIAIDACLGDEDRIGEIQVRDSCLFPGKGVGKKLPSVGDIAIAGIVDSAGTEEFFFLHNIRLNLIMKMSIMIAKAINYTLWKMHNGNSERLLEEVAINGSD